MIIIDNNYLEATTSAVTESYYESDYFELYKIVKDKTVFITKIEYGGH